MRFIHTADWQLGKPFGGFDAETRSALTEAQFDAIDVIGKAAARVGALHVLVAGDVFDTEGPRPIAANAPMSSGHASDMSAC